MSLINLTSTYHRSTYPSISPSKPSLSQAGRTVLITGGGGSIGCSFAKASASRVIVVGCRSGLLDEAVAKLQDEFGKAGPTEFVACQGDIAHFSPSGPDTLSMDRNKLRQAFDINVWGNFDMSAKFVQQPTDSTAKCPLYLVHVSTASSHMYPSPKLTPYSSSKTAFMALLGHIADERKVDDVQIISYHPGALYSEAASKANILQDLIKWDESKLLLRCLGSFPRGILASWTVWAHWDVNELREAAHTTNNQNNEIKTQLAEEKGYLKVGILGLPSISFAAFLNQ
ncbi:hypothetical protein GYMLUDRAFT_246118 [Collybiopsis luxurians FD-317 M1]|uniref:NAD(P)-binding protein n=1 Tax=Collybiopsis luxurians FD-317 M1 TaxID=944289 RepID=A0A0D0CRY3_9AGAR|nr:hypothetical protein GYMLUDRAFT_246118 [Collybiopsis luxurians FD-317 M1]